MKIDDAYTRWSSSYDEDRNLTRDLDRSVTEKLLGARRFETALELGCGTGKNTALLVEISTRMVALDFSPGMLKQAKDKIAARNVAFALADLTKSWPCPSDSFDLVAFNLVLEHIEDIDFAFVEAARCAKRGALVFVSELHPYRQYKGARARFDDGSAGVTRVPAFTHHVSEFVQSAGRADLAVENATEWSHAEDEGELPRLVAFELTRRP